VERLAFCPPWERAFWPVRGIQGGPEFRLRVAADRATRERAYRLACRVYREEGYARPDATWVVSPFDAVAQTLTLLAEDSQGREAATLTMVFDSEAGLPSDELYGAELSRLRAQGRRLGEYTRLAVDPRFSGNQVLIVSLSNFGSVFARYVAGATDFVIEVNPHHASYYRRKFLFEPLGPERPCPRVLDAPALLLRLDLDLQAEQIRLVGGTGDPVGGARRTIYSHYYSPAEETGLAAFLTRWHRPMSVEEQRYFGLLAGALL
jgi:hypothetical protein